jgi:hypothetical protein
MKMKLIWSVAVVVAMLFLINVGYASAKEVISKAEKAERKKIIKESFDAGDRIVAKTKDKDSAAIMKFLHESSYLCVPVFHATSPATMVAEDAGKKKFYLGVVALMEKDRKVSTAWQEEYDFNQAAVLMHTGNNVMLVLKKSEMISDLWRGFILIHEGSHALAFAVGVFDDIDDQQLRHAVDELYAYRQETRVIEKVGGKEYQKILAEEIARIEKAYKKDKAVTSPDYSRYKERLEKIFGKSKSDFEVGIRGSVLWINAWIRLMEKIYPPDEVERRQVDFFWSAYGSGLMK